MKPRTREQLDQAINTLIEYMLSKVASRDWHAVADAAMDLRELEVELRLCE